MRAGLSVLFLPLPHLLTADIFVKSRNKINGLWKTLCSTVAKKSLGEATRQATGQISTLSLIATFPSEPQFPLL